MTVVGLISDTHGLLRPEALAALADSKLIIHAGDIGSAAVLDKLRDIAPVTAVRGNNDFGPWAEAIPEHAELAVGEVRILVLHDLAALRAAEGHGVVVSGHSHQPKAEKRGGVLFINPGSAGPRRFRLPISLGKLRISGGAIEHELISL